MVNIGGPKESERRLLASVDHALKFQMYKGMVSSIQRKTSSRVCCAYRTIRADKANVTA